MSSPQEEGLSPRHLSWDELARFPKKLIKEEARRDATRDTISRDTAPKDHPIPPDTCSSGVAVVKADPAAAPAVTAPATAAPAVTARAAPAHAATAPTGRLECWGEAKEALKAYRRFVAELEEQGQRKPDMVAYGQLRHKWAPERKHGELEGVPGGLVLQNRGEAAILGVHQSILRGIDYRKDDPCYAICISGGYVDDDEDSESGVLYYTGEGGQSKQGIQIKDQEETGGNRALMLSIKTGKTIRVIRGNLGAYHYLGLYRCVDFEYEEGKAGKKVFKFKLVPNYENQSAAARAIPIHFKSPGATPKKDKAYTIPKKKRQAKTPTSARKSTPKPKTPMSSAKKRLAKKLGMIR